MMNGVLVCLMDRYEGQSLGETPHIVVLGSYKVGNFVVTVPLLRSLRRKYPLAKIDFWGSEVTKEFEEEFIKDKNKDLLGLIDWRISWDLDDENAFLNLSQTAVLRGKPDLVINCDGFNPVTKVIASWLKPTWVVGGCMSDNLRKELYSGTKPNNKILDEQEWDSKEFLEKYKNHLQSQYIAELICAMSFIEPLSHEIKNISLPSRLPKIEVPEVLIHCTAQDRQNNGILMVGLKF